VKKITAFFLICLLFFGSVSLFAIDEKGITILRKAKGAIEYGKEIGETSIIKDAIRSLNEFLVTYPNDLKEVREAYTLMGDAYFVLEEYSNAIESYKRGIKSYNVKDKRYYYALYSIAYSYYKVGDYKNAIENFKMLLNSEYSDEAMFMVGVILFEQGDYQRALIELENVKNEPWRSKAFYYIGKAYRASGLSDRAIEYFERAAKSEDQDIAVVSLYEEAELLLATGNNQKALEVARRLYKNYSNTHWMYEILMLYSEALYKTGNYTEGIKELEKSLSKTFDPEKRCRVLYATGWFYYRTGQKLSAINVWKKAMYEWNGELAYQAGMDAANTLRELKNYSKALETYEELLARFPNKSLNVNLKKIEVLLDMKEYEKALVILKEIEKTKPFEAKYWLTYIYKSRGDYKSAMNEVENLLKITTSTSEKVRALLLQGDVYFQMGDYVKAQKAYEEIMQIGSTKDKIQANLNLGLIMYALGNYEKAVDYFKYVLERSEVNIDLAADAAYYLAETMVALGKFEEAEKYYSWLINNDKSGRYTETVTIKKIGLMIERKEYQKAINTVDSLLARSQGKLKGELLYLKGEALLKLNRTSDAYKVVKNLNVENLSDQAAAGTLYIIATYFNSRNNLEEAEKNYQLILKNYPHTSKAPWAALDYAVMFYQKGDYEKAKLLFFNVITSYPSFEKADAAFYYIGRCYEYLGDKSKAIKVYQDFLDKFPTSSKRKEVINRLEVLKK